MLSNLRVVLLVLNINVESHQGSVFKLPAARNSFCFLACKCCSHPWCHSRRRNSLCSQLSVVVCYCVGFIIILIITISISFSGFQIRCVMKICPGCNIGNGKQMDPWKATVTKWKKEETVMRTWQALNSIYLFNVLFRVCGTFFGAELCNHSKLVSLTECATFINQS